MRVGILTLGCDKNTVDSEYLAGLLEDCDVLAIDEYDPDQEFDVVVVATCGFIKDAKRQSVAAILEIADNKKLRSNPKYLYVSGCLAQRYAQGLMAEIPEIDAMVGVGQFEQLAGLIRDQASNHVNLIAAKPEVTVGYGLHRKRLDAKPYAFLKIADGCNHACTFCAIPKMKGRLRSVPHEILLDEARALLDTGARELNIIAQDISVYGQDRVSKYRLPELLHDLAALDGDFWIRCLYCYPGGVTDALMDAIASEPKIVPYLDIPFQHFDPGILKAMKRPAAELDAPNLVEKLRERIPGIALRTTMLVGFPGETAQAHRHMLETMKDLRFDCLGAFPYSEEDGTAAAEAPRQVSKSTREKRWQAVMALQAEIAREHNRGRLGQRARVLVEDHEPEQQFYIARSPAEAPEFDGAVLIRSSEPIPIGAFVEVEVIEAETYDLVARPL